MSLPNGYRQLEYIQSTGTQYIDTGFKPNQDTRVVMDCYLDSAASTMSAFGAWNSTSKGAFIHAGKSNNSGTVYFYGSKNTTLFIAKTGRNTIDCNKNQVTIGSLSGSVSSQTFSCNYNMLLMAYNNAGLASNKATGKIYSCQIYDNGTLVRDFIPCQKPDGTIGLWDDVNSVFYGNAGTGKFTAGTVIAIATDESKIKKLKYIQSSGTQYVDTLFNPTQNTQLVLDVAFLGSAGTNVAGVRNNFNDTINRFGIISFGSDSKLGAFFRDSSIKAVTLDNNRHLYDLSKDGLVFDGTSYGGANTGSFSCTYSLTLFAWNNGANGVACNLCKVYSCKIYDNDVLVRDFVPCINDSGEVGLYDLVEKMFYINAGTGDFISGGYALDLPVNIGGTWKDANEAFVNIGGTWKTVEAAFVNIGGTWKELG